ncbi:hypothetical protein AJ80_02341 [Polytolypa hystricis UAMH7299]|uniref:GPI inositol-deacylase winged helix domain-containing protein n=1 Tax=Polytolypa hystricis (strain UAMH7299) TaxID=1447883 RepID=A0A2B7YR73_POLH7|nr:hypothetical protein AJ80_02341 [Polytolypa hystricis UAMH7299]
MPDITGKFQGGLTLEISPRKEDLTKYVVGQMDLLPSFVTSSPDLQKKIKAEIPSVANGMFLLAARHMNELSEQPTRGDLESALHSLPTALDESYERTMSRIKSQGGKHQSLAEKVLSWVVCAKEPLYITELQHAVAVKLKESNLDESFIPPTKTIESICAGLVTIDQSNVFRLAHYTAKEYFERKHTFWLPDAGTMITTSCVTYLSYSVFATGFCDTDYGLRERLRFLPLYKYASSYWGDHAREAPVLDQQIIQSFLGRDKNVEASTQALLADTSRTFWPAHYFGSETSLGVKGLHLAAYFGLRQTASAVLTTTPSLLDERESTAVHRWYGPREAGMKLLGDCCSIKELCLI